MQAEPGAASMSIQTDRCSWTGVDPHPADVQVSKGKVVRLLCHKHATEWLKVIHGQESARLSQEEKAQQQP